MSNDTLPKWVKPLLEFGPVLAFFVAYLAMKGTSYKLGGSEYDGFILVTALFVPLLLVCTAILWKLTGKISPMQIMTAVLVTVFGGLTVWLNDDRFIKMKPTIVYFLFAGILWVGEYRGTSYLEKLMGSVMPLTEEGWKVLGRRWIYFFVGMAILNEVLWRNLSTDQWVQFKVFGFMALTILFVIGQMPLYKKFHIEKAD